MRNIENVVIEYLSRSTNHAIQIVGNWGSGKTYYYRTVLEKIVEKTPVVENNQKSYKPIYISLFGLKTTEDIETKIVAEFYSAGAFNRYVKRFILPWKKTLMISAGIFKIGLRGF